MIVVVVATAVAAVAFEAINGAVLLHGLVVILLLSLLSLLMQRDKVAEMGAVAVAAISARWRGWFSHGGVLAWSHFHCCFGNRRPRQVT